MSKRRNHSKGITQDEFQWILTIAVLVLSFLIYFTWFFFSNCVFHWPIRWDVRTCWNEQVTSAKEKASEKAVNFVP